MLGELDLSNVLPLLDIRRTQSGNAKNPKTTPLPSKHPSAPPPKVGTYVSLHSTPLTPCAKVLNYTGFPRGGESSKALAATEGAVEGNSDQAEACGPEVNSLWATSWTALDSTQESWNCINICILLCLNLCISCAG